MGMIEEQIRKVFDSNQAEVLISLIREFFSDVVKAKDFNELKEIVKELAEAQKRTEQKVEELAEAQRRTEQKVEELAEAQKRTEEEIKSIWQVIRELSEAQKRTEQRVEELTEAQRRTEQRVEELTEAQRRTEQRIEELAEAQKKTEEEIRKLTEAHNQLHKDHENTKRMLAGLSDTVGYTLENSAYLSLPKLLKRDFGIEVVGELDREYVKIDSGYEEVNILGEGVRGGERIYIVGEGKVNLSRREVDKFVRKVERLRNVLGGRDIFKVIVVHTVHPEVREYAYNVGVDKIYKSSELEKVKNKK